jgi:hypothetical protein
MCHTWLKRQNIKWSEIRDSGSFFRNYQPLLSFSLGFLLFISPYHVVSRHRNTSLRAVYWKGTISTFGGDRAHDRTLRQNKLRGFDSQENYTDRATAACRRS